MSRRTRSCSRSCGRRTFTTIFVRIESPRAARLRETGRSQDMREDMKRAVRRIQEHGLEVMSCS